MFQYSHEMYVEDTDKVLSLVSDIPNIHIIAPIFGSLPLVTTLRNHLKCKVSIVKMSKYFDSDLEASWIYKDNISENENIVIIDDLYDTGETLENVYELVKTTYPNNKIQAITLFGKEDVPSWVRYIREYPGEWIRFVDWEPDE